MSDATPDPRRLSVADLYITAYLAASLPVFLLLPPDIPGRWSFAALHAAVLVAVVAARKLGVGRSWLGAWMLDLYPVPLVALLYLSSGTLNRILYHDSFLDAPIMGFEAAVFGGQPSMTLREAWPSDLLSEYFHLAYVLYYVYLASLALTLVALGRRQALRMSVATVMLVYVAGFVTFCLVPVAGPYWHFPRLDVNEYGHGITRLAHWIVSGGSSLGTAFPSSHVSVSVCVWVLSMRYARRLALVLAFFIPAMAVGTVYGGFHYATDMLAGALLGILGGTVGHDLTVRIAAARNRRR